MPIQEDFSRRKFIRYSVVGGAVVPFLAGIPVDNEVYGGIFNFPKDFENMTEMERIHLPKVTMPPVVEDGTQASIIVSLDHPMEEDHYIKSIQILNFADPVVIKGKFYMTQIGRASCRERV